MFPPRGLHKAFALMLTLLAGHAPLQCGWRKPPPEAERTETAGEALWNLAERFGAEGDAPARERTLRYLVERYPSSRFAKRAADELGVPVDNAAPRTH